MQVKAWNGWFHCTCNTYGTWFRGDHRGWCERHHRKHIDSDYKRPPKKGSFEHINKKSKDAMKRDPVFLEAELRRIALLAIVTCLMRDGIDVLVACLDDHHLHVLGRFRDYRPRQRLGWAKFEATKKVKAFINAHGAAVGIVLELKRGEGIWGKRSDCKPVGDREHRLNSLKYIAGHWKRGELVWLNPKLPRYVPSI
jgi:hypothetical protein